jgi:hypothetical protein
MDSIILNWISDSISSELHQVVSKHSCTVHHLWLAIENQFLSNYEQHTHHHDATLFAASHILVAVTPTTWHRHLSHPAPDALSN